MSLTKKIDFAIIIDVEKANPNGDPLDANRPRVDFDGFGEISDVCLKRKIRNRLAKDGKSIFVVTTGDETDGNKSLKERFDSFIKNNKNATPMDYCGQWFDVRAFGQVFAFKKGDKGDGASIGIRGPVSIQSATSLEQVLVTSMQITKSVNSESTENGKKSSDTMGMKHRVERGCYVSYGAISAQLSEKTGFSDDDANAVKKALLRLFDGDSSSARPEGSMTVRAVVWWTHNCPSGNYSSYEVHKILKEYLKDNPSASVAEINHSLNGKLPELTMEVIKGF